MIMPYLNFSGNCEEAFLWYEKIFDGKIQHLARYGDIPLNPDMLIPENQKNWVMHAQLMLTETGGISGADAMWPTDRGSALSIHAHLPTEALAQNVFSKLSEGGTILSVLTTNPPPDDSGISGSLKDRYGFTWIISALKS